MIRSLLLLLLGAPLIGAQIATPVNADRQQPAAPEAAAEPVGPLEALDRDTINSHKGELAIVEGTVTDIFWVRESVLIIAFQDAEDGFVAVSFKRYREALDKAFDGDITQALEGKTLQIQGKITEHNYRPQIVVESADQITIKK